MEVTNDRPVDSVPSERSRKPRSRPRKPKSTNQQVDDVQVKNNPQPSTATTTSNPRQKPSKPLIPRSVMKNSGSILNPTAAEFKPSGSDTATTVTLADTVPTSKSRRGNRKPNQNKNDSQVDTKQTEKENADQVQPSIEQQHHPHHQQQQQHETVVPSEEETSETFCSICTDNAKYFAVGRCNHHICSMCAVRMRIKSKNNQCAICKEELKVMIIFQPQIPKQNEKLTSNPTTTTSILRPFLSFGLSEDDCEVDHANLPGVRVDPSGGFLYVNCSQHYTDIENLRAIICPLKSCKIRFPNINTLQKHLKDIHSGLALCTLCIDNRPLFISEHQVMTMKQLQAHMKGEEYTMDTKTSNSHMKLNKLCTNTKNIHTKGHPACQFCTERFFDKSALYSHMQRNYFTCHLCPRQYMFRYYVDAAAIREHHQQEHIICNICASLPQLIASDIAIAFRDVKEYSEHMRNIHNAGVSNAITGSNHRTAFRLGASTASNNLTAANNYLRDKNNRTRVTVVDLDMGSANPFSTPDTPMNPTTRNKNTLNQYNKKENLAQLIPTNMRIAGRITGAGRFAELDESDLLLQAAAEEYAAAQRVNRPGNYKNYDRNLAFPALDQSNTNANTTTSTAAVSNWGSSMKEDPSPPAAAAPNSTPSITTAELHPMSLLHTNKLQQERDLQRKKDHDALERAKQVKLLQEEKRIERNLALASALLSGKPSSSSNTQQQSEYMTLTAAEVGATLMNKSYVNSLLTPLQYLNWNESDLMRPIYPPVLVNWARLNKTELMKIEKKLYTLMNDPQLNSIQLKPMIRGMRIIVHHIARMYLLNTYEFDKEPNRYVSVVKQVDSYLPSWTLSRAAALPLFTLPGEKGEELPDVPVIFLVLSSEAYSAGLVNTNSSVSSAGKKTLGSSTATASSAVEPVRIAFTCAEVIGRIHDLLASPSLWAAWYQYAVATSSQELESVPVVSTETEQTFSATDLPPPPPGFLTGSTLPAAASTRQVKSLSDLTVPRLSGLISAGASSIGLRFPDRSSAQLASLFLQYCLAVNNALNIASTAQPSAKSGRSAALMALHASSLSLSVKQQQELMVLSVFQQHPAFTQCSVAEIVYGVPANSATAVGSAPVSGVKAAALDRRHYMSTADPASEDHLSKYAATGTYATPATASTYPESTKFSTYDDDGWQYQAVKTRRYDGDVSAAAVSMPIKESWEDFSDIPAINIPNHSYPKKMSENCERNEEWERFLQEKRDRKGASQESAVPRYQPKRPAQTSVTSTDAAISTATSTATAGTGKYIPPSARTLSTSNMTAAATVADSNKKTGGLSVFKPASTTTSTMITAVAEEEHSDEEYDFCTGTASVLPATAAELVSTSALPAPSSGAQAPAVYSSDYLDSEEAFEAFLRQTQLEHTQSSNSSVQALPYHPLVSPTDPTHITTSSSAASSIPNYAPTAHAMPAIAVPLSDDMTEEEVQRLVLTAQMRRDKKLSQYNKFGVLEDDDAENED